MTMTQTVSIPAKWRAVIYGLYATVGVSLGGLQVGFSSAQLHQPIWLTVALSVFTFVGGAVGLTAASHTPAAPDAPKSDLDSDLKG